MNCISVSLFGYNNQQLSDSFPFASYFRGLSFNMKMAELLYPSWRVHVTLDEATYNKFNDYFDYHIEGGRLDVTVTKFDDLCMLMLQRMAPIFTGKYDRVLCRDLDSQLSYKERQAVDYWMSTGRIAHCITDSVSHNVALMGGMIGFTCKEFREVMRCRTFKEFTQLGKGIDFNIKGSDQTFLQRFVLPKVANSMVEHYLLGLPQSFRGECYNYVQDIVVQDIKPELKESNEFIEHIGATGFRQDATLRFFDKNFTSEQKEYYDKAEDMYPEVFYWRLPV